MSKVVVPIDLGGSRFQCLGSPPKRDRPSLEVIKALIWNYKNRYGFVDEVAFFHSGKPSDEELSSCHPFPIRLSIHPLDLLELDIQRLWRNGVKRVEIQVLSLQQIVLRENKRGYTVDQCQSLITNCRDVGMEVGVIQSPGLPRYSPQKIIEDVCRFISIGVDYVNIFPTIVWKDSGLAVRYKSGNWEPMSIEAAVLICREMVDLYYKAGIQVPRIGLQPGQDIRAIPIEGPVHPNLRSLVQYRRFYDMLVASLAGHQSPHAVILVNPKDISLAKGEGGENIKKLRARLGLTDITLIPCSSIPRGQVQKEK
jgi:hypothetical protein